MTFVYTVVMLLNLFLSKGELPAYVKLFFALGIVLFISGSVYLSVLQLEGRALGGEVKEITRKREKTGQQRKKKQLINFDY